MASRKDEREGMERAAEQPPEMVAEAGRQARRNVEAGSEAALEAGNRMASQAVDMGRRQAESMRSMMGAGTRVYSDVNELSGQDVNALMESSARLAKGVQDMGMEVMNYTQQSLELGLRTANEIMTCRTVEDMMNVQRNFMRQSVDTFLQESTRLLEMSSSTASEAVHPIKGRGQGMRH